MRKYFKKNISKDEAYFYGKRLGIDFRKIKFGDWYYGVNVEVEHSLVSPKTNVTDNDILKTCKIALAHLNESKLYYQYLKKMEKELGID